MSQYNPGDLKKEWLNNRRKDHIESDRIVRPKFDFDFAEKISECAPTAGVAIMHKSDMILKEIAERKERYVVEQLMRVDVDPEALKLTAFLNFDLQNQLSGALKELRKYRWIPVGEKLPDEDVKVLVCCKTTKGVRSVNMAYLLNGFWHGQGSMSGVTHWMPLPELPEEVEHETD